MEMEKIEKKGLDRNLIKYVAMFTMFLNHFAHAFLKEGLLYEIFLDIGFFTAITMCYFLVEGYQYTRSKKKYAQRLFVFGVITQVPYMFLFHAFCFNMMFSLLFCFLILCLRERLSEKKYALPCIILLFIACVFSDWMILTPIFTLLLANAYGDRKKLFRAYGICIGANFLMNFISFAMNTESNSIPMVLLRSAGASVMLCISALVILFLYKGRKSSFAPRFNKWFFYLFYPGHIILLLIIRMILN